jgi:hypothetical protein
MMSKDKIKDLELDTSDKHEDGSWSGWIFTGEVAGGSIVPEKKLVYLTINAN